MKMLTSSYGIGRIFLLVAGVTVVMAQSPEPPLSDHRLTIHTLLREDLFAGFLADDMERFSRGEKNIEVLLEKRPESKSELLAWKGSTALYRAVRAYENKQPDEFQRKYQQALDLFAEANRLTPRHPGVAAVVGGSYGLFSDRLPKEHRLAGWSQAYDAFQLLWKQQSPAIDKLPVHLRGELLAGMTQSAQRTGRTEETAQYLDKMLTLLRDTPYESAAKQWKENPKSADSTNVTCRTCHEPGRLTARLAAIGNK